MKVTMKQLQPTKIDVYLLVDIHGLKYSKKILFFFVLLCVWYYIMNPYFSNLPMLNKRVKEIKADNSIVFTPYSGRNVLPVETQVVLLAIDSFKLKDYKLFESFGVNSEVYQRINESAWPLINDSNSRNLFGYTNELLTVPGIKIKLEYKDIGYGTY